MRVKVYAPDDKTKFIGFGEMHREELIIVDDNDETKIVCKLPDHPHIKLDNGDMIVGLECWWTEDDGKL